MLKYGFGQLVKDEYVYPIVLYVWDNNTKEISIEVSIERITEFDNMSFEGVAYSLHLLDKKHKILSIPVLIEPDSLKSTEKICGRRKRNSMLAIHIGEFIKKTLQEDTRISHKLKEVAIIEDFKVEKEFFIPVDE